MTTKKKPGAPAHLAAATRQWWSEVARTYDLGPAQIRLLTMAAEALDRYESARKAVTKKGVTYDDRFGAPRTRPEVAVERDSRIAVARLLNLLGLPGELRPHGTGGKFGL